MTDKLLLDRWMGNALPEDYVAWGGELLVDGRDTPSLRVLAGLNPILEMGDIDEYFRRSCKELKLRPLESNASPRDAVPFVRRLYRSGTFSPVETLRLMSKLYELSDHSDPLLGLWFAVNDDFFPEVMDFLEEWIDREWGLFDQAAELELPSDFYRFVRCESCRHIGESTGPSFLASLRVLLTRGYAAADTMPRGCAKCGGSRLKHMGYADVQEDYFSRLRRSVESI